MDFFLMSFAFDTYTSTEMIREQKNKQSINETSLNKFLDLSHDQGHALALSQCLRFFPFVLFFVPYSNERGVHSPAGRACATVRQLWGEEEGIVLRSTSHRIHVDTYIWGERDSRLSCRRAFSTAITLIRYRARSSDRPISTALSEFTG